MYSLIFNIILLDSNTNDSFNDNLDRLNFLIKPSSVLSVDDSRWFINRLLIAIDLSNFR